MSRGQRAAAVRRRAVWVVRRANRRPVRPGGPVNPMQRSPSAPARTGSPWSAAAPALFPPSLLATFDEAKGLLFFGTLLALGTIGLVVVAWRRAGRSHWLWPVGLVLVAAAVGIVAFCVLVFGLAVADCAPDAYECPL